MSLPHRLLPLHRPDLHEVANCLSAVCEAEFEESSVSVVECPDLSSPPYHLAGCGLSGSPTMVHTGGVPFLLPSPNLNKIYDIRRLLLLAECPDGLAVGAGAASWAKVGKNAEFVVNVRGEKNNSRVASVVNDNENSGRIGNCRLVKPDFAELAVLGDTFCCHGDAGPVLRVRVTRWRREAEFRGRFTSMLANAMRNAFTSCSLPVGLGGLFVLRNSPARLHVMPDFSRQPLTCDSDVDNWLHFFNSPAPIVCLGTLLSHDPLDWGLRLEHFHGWNPVTENIGGHYHYDIDSSLADYECYLSLADNLLRVDPPRGIQSLRAAC